MHLKLQTQMEIWLTYEINFGHPKLESEPESESTLFPYNYKTQYIQTTKVYTKNKKKTTLYGGVIKRPGIPEHYYP